MHNSSSSAILVLRCIESKRVFAPAVIKLAAKFGSSLTLSMQTRSSTFCEMIYAQQRYWRLKTMILYQLLGNMYYGKVSVYVFGKAKGQCLLVHHAYLIEA